MEYWLSDDEWPMKHRLELLQIRDQAVSELYSVLPWDYYVSLYYYITASLCVLPRFDLFQCKCFILIRHSATRQKILWKKVWEIHLREYLSMEILCETERFLLSVFLRYSHTTTTNYSSIVDSRQYFLSINLIEKGIGYWLKIRPLLSFL